MVKDVILYVGGGVLVGWFSVAIVDEMETHERKARPHSASSAAICTQVGKSKTRLHARTHTHTHYFILREGFTMIMDINLRNFIFLISFQVFKFSFQNLIDIPSKVR